MSTLALIIPKRTSEKHPCNPIARSQRFLNFGALALGTYLKAQGHEVAIIDEYALNDDAGVLLELVNHFGKQGPQAIGISCISAYSADRALWLSKTFKDTFPKATIIAGGQHFAGLWAHSFERRFPAASVLIGGEAEVALAAVLRLIDMNASVANWSPKDLPRNVWFSAGVKTVQGSQGVNVVSLDEVVCAKYSLYPSALNLFPSLEFSRGCAYACVFCANTTENRRGFRRVGIRQLRNGLDCLAEYFQRPNVGFYMQASDFVVTEGEARELADAFSGTKYPFAWRTEVRVDELSPKCLHYLHDAGLRYLDIGLESASKSTLLAMNKTKMPDAYLSCAEQLLEAAANLGIFTKVNFLIHPGDSHATVQESLNWLKSHRDLISGISSGVTLEYEGTPLSNRLSTFSTKFGTKRREHELSKWGVYQLDPSADLSLEEAEILARSVAQELQTREAFARSKQFGYLSTDIELESILADLPEANHTTPYS